jgi:hypothetical protein
MARQKSRKPTDHRLTYSPRERVKELRLWEEVRSDQVDAGASACYTSRALVVAGCGGTSGSSSRAASEVAELDDQLAAERTNERTAQLKEEHDMLRPSRLGRFRLTL